MDSQMTTKLITAGAVGAVCFILGRAVMELGIAVFLISIFIYGVIKQWNWFLLR